MTDELDSKHHDFLAKLTSVREALQFFADREIAPLAISAVGRLQKAIWEQGLWREFETDVEIATRTALSVSDFQRASEFLSYRSGLHEALGDWPHAIKLAHAALKLEGGSLRAKSEANLHLGVSYYNLGQREKAKRHLATALEQATEDHDRARILHKSHRIERVFGNVEQAAELLNRAWHLADSHENWFRAELMLDRAWFKRTSDPCLAIRIAEQARDEYIDLNFPRGIAYANLELAYAHIALRNVEAAKHAVSSARLEFEKSGYLPGLANTYYLFGQIERSTGNFEIALQYFDESYFLSKTCQYFNGATRSLKEAFLVSVASQRITAALRRGLLLWRLHMKRLVVRVGGGLGTDL